MKVTFLGHACFQIDTGKEKILIDPFLTGNALAAVSADEVEADLILVTHGHGDHVGDAEAIARRTGAKIICTVDLAEGAFAGKGLNVIAGNLGGKILMPFGSVKFVQAIHGSGVAGTLSNGFLITAGDKKIYHAGDTALTMDMQLLKADNVDLALLPIGDFFTMGPEDALRAAEMIQAKTVVPMHYDTFPPIRQDPEEFVKSVKKAGLRAEVLKPGESIEV